MGVIVMVGVISGVAVGSRVVIPGVKDITGVGDLSLFDVEQEVNISTLAIIDRNMLILFTFVSIKHLKILVPDCFCNPVLKNLLLY